MSSSLGKRGRSTDEHGQTYHPDSRLPSEQACSAPSVFPSPGHHQPNHAASPTPPPRIHSARGLARSVSSNAPASDSMTSAATGATATHLDAGLDRNAPTGDGDESLPTGKRPKLQHVAEDASHAYTSPPSGIDFALPPTGIAQRDIHHIWNTARNSASPLVSPMSGNNNSYSSSTTTQHTHINYAPPEVGYMDAPTRPANNPSLYPQYANASSIGIPPFASANYNATPASAPLVVQQPSAGLLNARNHFNKSQWHGVEPKQYPDVDALQRRLFQAAMDRSSYYDGPTIIDRLNRANFSQADIEMACYHLVDVLVKLHTPGIGTKNRNKSDPTNEPAKKIERDWTLDERANLMCRALRECKKLLLDVVEKPNDVEYLLVLAPKSRLKSKFNNMDLNDGKKDEKPRKDLLIAGAQIGGSGDNGDDNDENNDDAASSTSIKPKKQIRRRSRTNSSGDMAPRRQARASTAPTMAPADQRSLQGGQTPVPTVQKNGPALYDRTQAHQHNAAPTQTRGDTLQKHAAPQQNTPIQLYGASQQHASSQQYGAPQEHITPQQHGTSQQNGIARPYGAPQQYAASQAHTASMLQPPAAAQYYHDVTQQRRASEHDWAPSINNSGTQPLVGTPSPMDSFSIFQGEHVEEADNTFFTPLPPPADVTEVQPPAMYESLAYASSLAALNQVDISHAQAAAVTSSPSVSDSAPLAFYRYNAQNNSYNGLPSMPGPYADAGEIPVDPALWGFNDDGQAESKHQFQQDFDAA